MNSDHLFWRHTSSCVQIVHVLRNEQELIRALGKSCDCFMRGIRLRIADALPPFAIPLPNQFRIARECLRRRKLCRVNIPPVTVPAAKSRDAALRRNTRAGQNESTHNPRSKRNSGYQIITSQNFTVATDDVVTPNSNCHTRAHE